MEQLGLGWEFLIAAFGPLGPFYLLAFFGFLLILMTAPLRFPIGTADPFSLLSGSGFARNSSGAVIRISRKPKNASR